MAGAAHLVLGLPLALVVVLRRVSGRSAGSRPQGSRPGPPPGAVGRPVELVAADLRRLGRQLAELEGAGLVVRD